MDPIVASERRARATLDALSAHIAIVDDTGVIADVNRAWRDFSEANNATAAGAYEGANYLAVCDAARGPDSDQAGQVAAAIRSILSGTLTAFSIEYPCHSPDQQRWFQVRVTSYGDGAKRVVVAHENITERMLADAALQRSREQMRALAARLQDVREEERTRVAREIHDVLAQDLTRLKIDLVWLHGRLSRPGAPAAAAALAPRVLEMSQLADATIHSVQRIATELRPAVLDSLGLCAAVEWHVREVRARSALACQADLPADELPVDSGVATAAFRIVQESLTNVLRHANATRVDVVLRREADHLVLSVHDDGRGITPYALTSPLSIGLTGMRERALLLGGHLEIRSQPGSGTTIEVRLPLAVGETVEDGAP